MNLLFLVPALPTPPTTGGEIFNHRLAEGLPREFPTTVITLKDVGATMETPPSEFVRRLSERLGGKVPPGPALIDTYFYSFGGEVIDALRSAGFGPVVGFGQAWYPGRYRSFLSRQRVRFALSRFLRRCDHHVVVSGAMKSETVGIGISPGRVETALPGFELAERAFEPGPRRPGPLRVKTAGTYMEAKGQHLIVEAIERLSARDPNLFATMTVEAIGSKSQTPEFVRGLETRAARLAPGLLRLNGARSQVDLWRAFEETDVFVFPAVGEGLGMVVVEAMLCGAIPVVSPDGPLREIVGEGSGAGLVVPRRADAIAKALLELARDPCLEERRAAARRRALDLAPTWDASVGRVAAAIRHASVPAAA